MTCRFVLTVNFLPAAKRDGGHGMGMVLEDRSPFHRGLRSEVNHAIGGIYYYGSIFFVTYH